jgi:predicted RNA methylase
MLNSANVRIILVIKSQGMLFDMPIQVGSSVDKHGRFRQAHTRIQKVRAKELPSVREPIAEEIKPNTRLAAWLDKHGGIGSVAKIVAEAPDAAQAKMIDLMAGVGKLTPEQARKLLDSAIPNDSQADLFAQAPKATDGTDDLFSQPATVKGKWKLKSPPPAEESHAQATEAIETEPPKAPEEKPAAKLTEAQKVGAGETAKLDYEGFRKEYEELFNRMMSYSPNEVGSGIYADKMAKLSDDYPEFMDRFDRNDDEIHNLKRIKAINERQGLDLDVAGMASQTLKESGRLPEVFADVPSAQPVTAPPHGEAIQFGVQAGITKQARRDLNAQAVAIVQRGGPFSDDDKAILRQYSGNGGCGDSLNEYYTRQDVAAAMWVALQSMGVMGGSVLEPSCGPGVFLHTAPNSFKVTGVEMDGVSAQVAKALHGDRHEIQNASLERFAVQDNRQFDAVIGNVPFGLRGSLIRDDKPHLKTAEAYFCDTAMDKCKAGGIVGLIVPTGVMDSRTNRKLREMLLRKGQFLGAQRMPNTAFEHAHTEVTTDIIWLRKYPDDVSGALSSSPVGQSQLKSLGIWDDEFLSGSYFTGRGAANIHGSMEAGWRAKAGIGADITVTGSMKDVADSLAMFKPEVAAKIPTVPDIMDAVGADEKARAKVLGATMTRPYEKQGKAGDTKTVDGIAYVLQGRPLRWHRVDEVVQSEALIQGRDIAARIETLIAGSAPVDRDQLQKDLHAWVALIARVSYPIG